MALLPACGLAHPLHLACQFGVESCLVTSSEHVLPTGSRFVRKYSHRHCGHGLWTKRSEVVPSHDSPKEGSKSQSEECF